MTEHPEDGVPIEDAESMPQEKDSDDPQAPVDEYDPLEDFQPATGWPDPGFEDVAFPPPDAGERVP
jgi:hypothetical protein